MRNPLTRRHDSGRAATQTPDGEVVDRRAAQDEPTTQRIMTSRTAQPRTVDGATATGTTATDDTTATGTTATDGTAAGADTTRAGAAGGPDSTTGAYTSVVPRTAANDDAADDTATPRRSPWAHVSAMATLSLIVGVLAVAATLTGLMAAEGIVLGVIGGAFAAGGLVSVSRRGVTGHSLALLGLVASLGAILLGVLAIGGELSWLDSETDEVNRLHSWLLSQLPWLKHF